MNTLSFKEVANEWMKASFSLNINEFIRENYFPVYEFSEYDITLIGYERKSENE